MVKHKTYELKLVCYSTKGGKEKKSARNRWQPENPHRLYWEDVPQILQYYPDYQQIYGFRRPMPMSAYMSRRLTWQGCGRAVAFGRIDHDGNSELDMYGGYATFLKCWYVADDTGFCKRHIASAIKDGKVKLTTRFFLSMKKMFNQILRR